MARTICPKCESKHICNDCGVCQQCGLDVDSSEADSYEEFNKFNMDKSLNVKAHR